MKNVNRCQKYNKVLDHLHLKHVYFVRFIEIVTDDAHTCCCVKRAYFIKANHIVYPDITH